MTISSSSSSSTLPNVASTSAPRRRNVDTSSIPLKNKNLNRALRKEIKAKTEITEKDSNLLSRLHADKNASPFLHQTDGTKGIDQLPQDIIPHPTEYHNTPRQLGEKPSKDEDSQSQEEYTPSLSTKSESENEREIKGLLRYRSDSKGSTESTDSTVSSEQEYEDAPRHYYQQRRHIYKHK